MLKPRIETRLRALERKAVRPICSLSHDELQARLCVVEARLLDKYGSPDAVAAALGQVSPVGAARYLQRRERLGDVPTWH
jgi:hypothetical protein